MKALIKTFFLLMLLSPSFIIPQESRTKETTWPETTQTSRPWSRWWWMGSALTTEGITTAMEEYKDKGIGGLEITPIYGVKGYEDQFINFLSPEWIGLLSHTLNEAERLDIGIDMATGTGWPFGGPWVDNGMASRYITYKTYEVKAGESIDEPVVYMQEPILRPVGQAPDISKIIDPIYENDNLQLWAIDQIRYEKNIPLHTLMAYSKDGKTLDLTDKVDEDCYLDWVAPEGEWTVYALFIGWHGKMVERAAPGGEGYVIDHFSKESLSGYLAKFDKAFTDTDISTLRSFFNDSYEVDDARGEANFTDEFFEEFKKRKEYDLKNYLNILLSPDSTEIKARILTDYREVISDLLLENFTEVWFKWAHNQNALIRNQAHGSPANILDLYAVSDIPEGEGMDILRLKCASSAANVSGKNLASSETATWLDEHFTASLAKTKRAVDICFISGINHIVYHGTTYSPQDETWPGWMFYASTHFAPTNTYWNDFEQLNTYVNRCQSFLQQGNPANDILLYYPIYDSWSKCDNYLLQHFKGGARGTPARRVGQWLYDNNYSFDFISDKQIQQVQVKNNELISGKSSYQIILVPQCKFIHEKTFNHLYKLANNGATIVFEKELPEFVPGYYQYREKQDNYNELKSKLEFEPGNHPEIKIATVGKGRFLIAYRLDKVPVNVPIESSKELKIVKRCIENSNIYFIMNAGKSIFRKNIYINNSDKSFVIYNPMTGEIGKVLAELMFNSTEIELRLEPGETIILQESNTKVNVPYYTYYDIQDEPLTLDGEWTVKFIQGGPTIPSSYVTQYLESWSTSKNNDIKYFSGTARYTLKFSKPDDTSPAWLLNLGKVCESAKVRLNDTVLATLIASPFQIAIPAEILKDENTLEVDVTNLMANRIIYLEKQGYNYKKFYNINFSAKYPENYNKGIFNASHWDPLPSGLLGPVTLTPVLYN